MERRPHGQPDCGEVRAIQAVGFEEVGTAFDGVDARLAPLEGGNVDICVHGVAAGRCAIHRQPANSGLFAEGTVTEGSVGLLFVSQNDGGARYNGEVLPRGSAVLYGAGAVHTGAGRGAREIIALTFPAEVCRSSVSALLQEDAPGLEGHSLRLGLDRRAQRDLHGLLQAPERALGASGDVVQAGHVLREETVPAVCALLAETLAAPASPAGCSRDPTSLFHDARDFLHANYHQPMQLADLCRAVGVSAESLRLAFQQYVRMPPMRYLRTLRLMRCREKLSECDPGVENVKTVAHGCGIRELGRFAAAYRRLYGRLPSEDLPRPRSPRP